MRGNRCKQYFLPSARVMQGRNGHRASQHGELVSRLQCGMRVAIAWYLLGEGRPLLGCAPGLRLTAALRAERSSSRRPGTVCEPSRGTVECSGLGCEPRQRTMALSRPRRGLQGSDSTQHTVETPLLKCIRGGHPIFET